MDLEYVLENRCSVRHFSDKVVDDKTIEKILDFTMKAPTAKNKQPYRIYIIKSSEGIAKIDNLTQCRYGAPYVALFTYRSDEMWINEEDPTINSGIEDASIAATFFMLEAFNNNVDTCWVNLFNNKVLDKEFNLDSNEHSVLLMPFGYRLDGVHASKLHNLKKDKNIIVKEL